MQFSREEAKYGQRTRKSWIRVRSAVYFIVHQICAIYQYNCTKNGKGLKIVTKESDTIKINVKIALNVVKASKLVQMKLKT